MLTGWAKDLEQPLIVDQLQWSSDLDGPLGTGRELGLRTLSEELRTITARVTDAGGMEASESVQLRVLAPIPPPSQCVEWLVNGDFEGLGWGAWIVQGESQPVVTQGEDPEDSRVLLLGNKGGVDVPGFSYAMQMVTVPAEAIHARLSLRYRVRLPGSQRRV